MNTKVMKVIQVSNDNVQALISNILDKYIDAKSEKFKGNTIASYLRKDVKDIIKKDIHLDKNQYNVEGSPGKGNWADVPWICLFDNDITNTATKGYYIGYLFCADMSGVYLSLNQGWTYFKEKYGLKEGREKIKKVSQAWKKILSSTLKDFSYEQIDLKSKNKNSNLPRGYELGHICGKFYKRGEIPSNETLKQDLLNLMGVYRELKGRLKNRSIEETNNFLIVNNDLGLLDEDNKKDESYVENIIEDLGEKSILFKEEPPININYKEPEGFTPRKTNFIKKAKNQKKLGYAGELMVINYEKKYLTSNGRKDLAKNIRHVSKLDGDGAGYDILSFELNGDKKYIEVKTTTSSKDTSFIVTAKEIEFSKEKIHEYYLYRIYDFNKQNNAGKFYVLKGGLNKLDLVPQQFLVKDIEE